MQPNRCADSECEDIYKDVVIVGNGPSSIFLSYMLSGNWPYYTGEPHPNDEMLTARLHYSIGTQTCSNDCLENDNAETESGNERRSCRCCSEKHRKFKKRVALPLCSRETLEVLSSDLEGRSGGRPLSLLMDQLQHPCVDVGMDVPPLLAWRSAKVEPDHKVIEHVVLGKGPPGGAWHSLDPNVLTISLSRWMSLPGLDLRQWEQQLEEENQFPGERIEQEKMSACRAASRVTVGTVAEYYKDYVARQGLQRYFRCGATVTSVRRENAENCAWRVEGFDHASKKRFRYFCKKVVLASGTTDSSNRLGIPGETTRSTWVTHDLSDLEQKLDKIASQSCKVHPVLVVGAGLTAADAIMASRFRGIPVLHVFRDNIAEVNDEKTGGASRFKGSNKAEKLQYLPDSIYPEYHKVYEMMSDGGKNYPLYKALPGHSLINLDANVHEDHWDKGKIVTLSTPDGRVVSCRVSIVAILIGFKPDLSYLEGNGLGLGKIADKSIDSKSNPIVVDDITHEVLNSQEEGLYALGPLVGDNFVRFILGGAFGAFTHILQTLA